MFVATISGNKAPETGDGALRVTLFALLSATPLLPFPFTARKWNWKHLFPSDREKQNPRQTGKALINKNFCSRER